MTAEVAIMNQHALVFAADSATTVTMWVKQENQIRYFKGANKLFQLSFSHPVGLMINDSASLHDVPWEIVIKEFRKNLANDSCSRLSDYSEKFFHFVEGHLGLFPQMARDQVFAECVANAIEQQLSIADESDEVKQANEGNDPQQVLLATRTSVAKVLDNYKKCEPKAPITSEDVESAVAAHLGETVRKLADDERATQVGSELLAELGIRTLMCNYDIFLPSTGVVLGGFGEEEFFPSLESFICYGFLDRHFIVCRQDKSCKQISSVQHSFIETFATDSMINSFRMGIGLDVYSWVRQSMKKSLREFAEQLRLQLAPDKAIEGLNELIETAENACQSDWFQKTLSEHARPLNRVVGSLPITDMSALAKSLIELQSLKERVTDSSESVSGPIDVAAITKHDGFVWIERKHYFRAELNPRFFARHRSLN